MNVQSKTAVRFWTWPFVSDSKLLMCFRSAFLVALLVVTALALSSCATMNEQECLMADWVTVGFADGAFGRPVTAIDAYRESCASHGVSPDLDAYRSGHADGVATYCRRQNGFQVGRYGTTYRGVCPVELAPDFLEGYNAARRLRELERAVTDIDYRIARLDAEQTSIAVERDRLQALILSSDTTVEERARYMARVERIDERIDQIPVEEAQLTERRPWVEFELLEYRETLALQGWL